MTHLSFTSSFKKIRPFFYGAVIVLLCVASINFFVDKKGVYSSNNFMQNSLEEYARNLMMSKSPIPCEENERLVKYYLGYLSKSSAYIIGSSRLFKIGKDILREPSVTNLAVSGASFEDFLLFLGMLLQKKNTPQKVYVIIDPWFFSKNSDIRYMELFEFYKKSLSSFSFFYNIPKHYLLKKKINNLLNKDYFYYNISSIFKIKKIDANLSLAWTDQTYNPDGTLNYSEAFEKKHQVITPQDIESGFSYKLDYIRIDPDILGKFRKAIKVAISKGVNFVFYILPYAPSIHLPQFKPLKEKLMAFQEALKEVSTTLEVPLWGNILPDGYGLTDADYYDGIHLKQSGIQKVFAKIRSVND